MDSSDLSSEWQCLSCSPQNMRKLLLSFKVLHGNLLSNTEFKLPPCYGGTSRRIPKFQILYFDTKRKWYGINKDQSLWVRVLLGYILHRVAVHKEKDTKLMEVEYETLLCLYKASITVTNLSASQVTAIKHTRPREATVLYIHCPSPASSPRPRSLRITYPSVIVIKLGLI